MKISPLHPFSALVLGVKTDHNPISYLCQVLECKCFHWKLLSVAHGLTAVLFSSVPSAREPEAIYRVFGRKLRELRDKKGIPQEELATLSGLTRSSIANIENGKQRVMLHHLVRFAEALRVDVGSLVPALKIVEAEAQDKKSAYLEQIRRLAAAQPEQDPSHEKDKR